MKSQKLFKNIQKNDFYISIKILFLRLIKLNINGNIQ
jgi:hypothetical protein